MPCQMEVKKELKKNPFSHIRINRMYCQKEKERKMQLETHKKSIKCRNGGECKWKHIFIG